MIYVANAGTGSIGAFSLISGQLKSVAASGYNVGTAPSAVAATPKGDRLYVANGSGSVLVYTIASDGTLQLGNGGNPVASVTNPTWMSIDRTGGFLFVISSGGTQLQEFQIDASNGTLTPTAQASIALDPGSPTQVYLTPNDQFVVVALGTGGVDIFTFDSSTGILGNQLHYDSEAPGTDADVALAADNTSSYLFVGEAGSGIRVLSIAADGTLTDIAGSPFASAAEPDSIAVDSTNAFLYVVSRTANQIAGYAFTSGGTLTALSSAPFSAGLQPGALSLDASGQYLVSMSNGGGPDLQVFSFDGTTAGKLDSVATMASGADPTQPVSITVVP